MDNRVYYGEYSLSYWIEMMLKGNIELPEYQRCFAWEEEYEKRKCHCAVAHRRLSGDLSGFGSAV